MYCYSLENALEKLAEIELLIISLKLFLAISSFLLPLIYANAGRKTNSGSVAIHSYYRLIHLLKF